MNAATKRAERIQTKQVDLPFRSPDGAITTSGVWREDILEWRPDDRFPPTFYLVLDFGREQRFTTMLDGEPQYEDTGRIQLDLQPLDIQSLDDWSPESVGLGPPVARFADMPTDLLGDEVGDEPSAGRPMVGWIPHSVSPRRQGRSRDDN